MFAGYEIHSTREFLPDAASQVASYFFVGVGPYRVAADASNIWRCNAGAGWRAVA